MIEIILKQDFRFICFFFLQKLILHLHTKKSGEGCFEIKKRTHHCCDFSLLPLHSLEALSWLIIVIMFMIHVVCKWIWLSHFSFFFSLWFPSTSLIPLIQIRNSTFPECPRIIEQGSRIEGLWFEDFKITIQMTFCFLKKKKKFEFLKKWSTLTCHNHFNWNKRSPRSFWRLLKLVEWSRWRSEHWKSIQSIFWFKNSRKTIKEWKSNETKRMHMWTTPMGEWIWKVSDLWK